MRETPHLPESDQDSKSTCSQRLDQILESFLKVKPEINIQNAQRDRNDSASRLSTLSEEDSCITSGVVLTRRANAFQQ